MNKYSRAWKLEMVTAYNITTRQGSDRAFKTWQEKPRLAVQHTTNVLTKLKKRRKRCKQVGSKTFLTTFACIAGHTAVIWKWNSTSLLSGFNSIYKQPIMEGEGKETSAVKHSVIIMIIRMKRSIHLRLNNHPECFIRKNVEHSNTFFLSRA